MRLFFTLALVAGCYQQSSFAPCTLTCGPAAPCPGDLVCGGDGLCHAAGAASCGEQPLVDAAVVDVPPVDAMIDAKPFTVADCPGAFNVSLPSTMSTSRYLVYVGADQRSFWEGEAACEGLTVAPHSHLMNPDDLQEVTEIAEHIQTITNAGQTYYVGIVQDPMASSPASGWIRLDGSQVSGVDFMWANTEPNDGNNVDAAVIDRADAFARHRSRAAQSAREAAKRALCVGARDA